MRDEVLEQRVGELESVLTEAHGVLLMVHKSRNSILVSDLLKRITKILSTKTTTVESHDRNRE